MVQDARNSSAFHLAVPAGNVEETKKFYIDILGCVPGNFETGRWQDINFWGNELTLHQSEERMPNVRHDVDMGAVAVPHFGVHLDEETFQGVKKRLEASNVEYLDKPYRRFVGTDREQETFFVEDPNGNVLEIKTMVDPSLVFSLES